MRANSQKALKILSITMIVCAILGTIAGILATLTGGAVMWSGAEVANLGGAEGISAEEAELLAGGGLIALMAGIVLIISGIVDLIIGVLGLGVAKDGRRVNLYAGLCAVGLAINAISIISSIAQGSFSIGSLIMPIAIGYALYLAIDIKKTLA